MGVFFLLFSNHWADIGSKCLARFQCNKVMFSVFPRKTNSKRSENRPKLSQKEMNHLQTHHQVICSFSVVYFQKEAPPVAKQKGLTQSLHIPYNPPCVNIPLLPMGSMYGIFTYTYQKINQMVGKYTIHGSYELGHVTWCVTWRPIPSSIRGMARSCFMDVSCQRYSSGFCCGKEFIGMIPTVGVPPNHQF